MSFFNDAGASEWEKSGFAGVDEILAKNAFTTFTKDSFGADLENGDDAAATGCHNCGQEGHFARECPEPRKNTGGCFNCGEDGHAKAECTAPRKFQGECRSCGQEGHMASECPTRVDKCKNCHQEGHDALTCKNPKFVDNKHVAEMSEHEAWDMLKQASDERDITDFKEAVLVLSKAAPDYTYPRLEKEFRKRGYHIFLIALENDHGDTWTNVNLQGETGKKYAVSYFKSEKPQRPTLAEKWPASPEENIARLADAGTPLDRGVDKCHNCGQLGHRLKACPEEKSAREQVGITCYLCGEVGHRVRDCIQERKRGGRACKICESEDHLARECPEREKQTCRNCGAEDHMARDCPTREKLACHNCGDENHFAKDCPEPRKMICRVCNEEGHFAKDCPKKGPIDWTKFTCPICNVVGHGRGRCPKAKEEAGRSGIGGNENNPNGGSDGGSGWEPTKTTISSAQAAWESAPAAGPPSW